MLPGGAHFTKAAESQLARDEGLRPDLLFFTGDASFGQIDSRTPDKTVRGQLRRFAKLLDAVRGVFEPEIPQGNVFLVPGNHDVNRDWVTPDQIAWLDQQKGIDAVRGMMQQEGLQWRRYMERLGDYRAFLEEYGLDHLLKDPERLIYSTTREVGDLRVGIAGFNSAWSCCRDGERGKLWMAGRYQQGVLRPGLRDADFSIALVHHPPEWLVEHENPDFGRGLERDFRFLLHGHEHRAWVQSIQDGNYTVLAAAACYERSDSKNNGYNVVRLDPVTKKGKVWLRTYDDTGGGWISQIIHDRTDHRGVHELRLHWLPEVGRTADPSPPRVEEDEASSADEGEETELDRYLRRRRGVENADERYHERDLVSGLAQDDEDRQVRGIAGGWEEASANAPAVVVPGEERVHNKDGSILGLRAGWGVRPRC